MSTDKHFNAPGDLPEPIEDHKPTDMPATVNMFIIIAAVAVISVVVMVAMHLAS
jgi:heme/copper-type cytochrome/quinol oxidase subunit 2